jgi:betaine-aldehyde dehydrogenase
MSERTSKGSNVLSSTSFPLPRLPTERGLFYGGVWRSADDAQVKEVTSPSTGESLGEVAWASATDVDRIVEAARLGFETWRCTPPLERARRLREAANVIRAHGDELALLDAVDCGSPVSEMRADARISAGALDYFAGLVTELKGASVPAGPNTINFSVREPLGVVARVAAYNHPLLFAATRIAAPVAAGNAVIVKPAEQAPLSGLRLAELIGDIFPPGVVNVVTGGREVGATLSSHQGVNMVTLVGGTETGRAVLRGAAETIKPVLLELGGKNALVAYPDCDPTEVAEAMINGMNFGWCGQSCGSLSRAFVHADIYEAVLDELPKKVAKYKPGFPMDPTTTMGALISREHLQRVQSYIAGARSQGARLLYGGDVPEDPELRNGNFLNPTIFVDVGPEMRIAREEIFGPVLSVLKWEHEGSMLKEVNALDYGLTAAIFTRDLDNAYRAASAIQAGYIWLNTVSVHVPGSPFGGVKQSGMGREECLAEALSFTQEKNIFLKLRGDRLDSAVRTPQ